MLFDSALVLVSCCSCVGVLEKLTVADSGCANLVTFSSFLFVAVDGLVKTSRFLTVRNRIPLKAYAKVVALFFLVNVINNQALGFHIPMTLHIIFRSGSLVSNLVLSKIMLNKHYTWRKNLSVIIISIGIFIATLATFHSTHLPNVQQENVEITFSFCIGVLMLIFALIFSSVLGVYQEKLYFHHGKHPKEAMFYVHALGLPLFLVFYKDIAIHASIFNQSELWKMPLLSISLPYLWLILLLNCILQYFCIRFVYELTATCSTLTVTFVITIRKFISLLISVLLFRNPFTVHHWIGTMLVFFGSVLFVQPSNTSKEKIA